MKQFLVTNKDNQIVDARRLRDDIISECFPFGIDIEISELTPSLIQQLAKEAGLAGFMLTLDILSQMQPQQPQLPVVETGVIELPENVSNIIAYSASHKNGDVVSLSLWPDLRKYCKPESIKTEVDYSKIPVGSVVKFKYDNENFVGFVKMVRGEQMFFEDGKLFYTNAIKSLQILPLPEGEK